jgi:Double zinc ribbon
MKKESKSWSLTEHELAALMDKNSIRVSLVSPLKKVEYDPTAKVKGPKTADPELIQAIEWVSEPRLELGLLLSPSVDGDIIRFYRGLEADSDALAGHRDDGAGTHHFAWTQESDLMPLISTCLMFDIPAEPVNISLELDPTEFQTFLGVVDCAREFALESLLNRDPGLERTLTASKILEAFKKSAGARDPRWLVGLAGPASPFDFALDRNRVELSLRSLADRGLLESSSGGWALSPRMQVICQALSSPLASCIMYRRHLTGDQQWERDHLMAIRGMGSQWLFRFRGLDSSDPRVLVRDTSNEEVELAISEQFQEWDLPRAGEQPAANAAKPERKKRKKKREVGKDSTPDKAAPTIAGTSCTKCGVQVPAGAQFCRKCGTPVGTPDPWRCPSCGTEIHPGMKFCRKCGSELPPLQGGKE